MLRFISLSTLALLFTLNIFSQSAKETAPVIWQKYQIPEKQISVFLPKMPIVTEWVDVCTETETKTYWAYAEEVVYQIRISSKFKKGNRDFCENKRNFGEEIFLERIKELKKGFDSFDETKYVQNKKEVTKIRVNLFDYWIFNDLENDKWVELIITHRANVNPNAERFIKSLEFSGNPSGISIGVGAEQILGDEISENIKGISSKSDFDSAAAKTEAIMFVSKPRANYTEAARRSSVKGTVTLKVTFLSNGSIGNISPDVELPDGLTDEAINAVKKIVFLPQKINGINVTVTKQIQYSFSIY